MRFPFYYQLGLKDCGPACIKMIAGYYGKEYDIEFLREHCFINKSGVSLKGINEAAEYIGLKTIGVKINLEELKEICQSNPCILHWNKNHFVVAYGYKKALLNKSYFLIADPAKGLLRLTPEEMVAHWSIEANNIAGLNEGIALVLESTPGFYEKGERQKEPRLGIKYLVQYFYPYRSLFIQLAIGMLLGSILALTTPLLAQTMIDKGVNMHNVSMIYLVLAAQLTMFLGSVLIQLVQSKILLHVGTRINVKMVSDFFYKLFNLPISFFDKHITGDLLQRISDHKRIENLLTVSSLTTVFSVFNMLVLLFMLGSYHGLVLLTYLVSVLLGFIWTSVFLAWRKKIDYKMFSLSSEENSKVIEMLDNIADIKISNSAHQHRWKWEEIQSNLYKQKIRNLDVGQVQSIGSGMLTQATNILISFTAATSVVNGNITLGVMFAISIVIGQLNGPLQQLYGFVNSLQQARIGMERIGNVLLQNDESDISQSVVKEISGNGDIVIKDLSFSYGSASDSVLNKINLTIPAGKVTAIVGESGSGKTTLLKLLLRFYEPAHGGIFLDHINIKNLHLGSWRDSCGVVMQDGKLFSATIGDNLSVGKSKNLDSIIQAAALANIDDFINSLPLSYMTEVGNNGLQMSMGQKQRILLARAIYKNPDYLFLDEATSSLDSDTELKIMESFESLFKGRTVVTIAHRLSTVKNADQIVVMERGKITEIGTHEELSARRGKYYQLVKNQLEVE